MSAEDGEYFIGRPNDPIFEDKRNYKVGFFMEGILRRVDFEFAEMDLPEVDLEPPHYHKLATELTYCISGRLYLIVHQRDEIELVAREWLFLPPRVVLQNPRNDPGTRIVVFKTPSVPGDKFYA